jgi:hypothetical protein
MNSAIYMGQVEGGIAIIDQFPHELLTGKPHPAQPRSIYYPTKESVSNNAAAYSVILCQCE